MFRSLYANQTNQRESSDELSAHQFPPSAETSGFCSRTSVQMEISQKRSGGDVIRVGEVWLMTHAWDVLATLLTSALLSLAPVEPFHLLAWGPKNQANESEYAYLEAVDGDEEKNKDGEFGDTEEELSSEDGGGGNNSNGKNSSKAGAGGDGDEVGDEGEGDREEDDSNRDDNDDGEVDGDEDKDDDGNEDNEDEGEDKDDEEVVEEEEPDDEEDEEEEEALQPPKKRKK